MIWKWCPGMVFWWMWVKDCFRDLLEFWQIFFTWSLGKLFEFSYISVRRKQKILPQKQKTWIFNKISSKSLKFSSNFHLKFSKILVNVTHDRPSKILVSNRQRIIGFEGLHDTELQTECKNVTNMTTSKPSKGNEKKVSHLSDFNCSEDWLSFIALITTKFPSSACSAFLYIPSSQRHHLSTLLIANYFSLLGKQANRNLKLGENLLWEIEIYEWTVSRWLMLADRSFAVSHRNKCVMLHRTRDKRLWITITACPQKYLKDQHKVKSGDSYPQCDHCPFTNKKSKKLSCWIWSYDPREKIAIFGHIKKTTNNERTFLLDFQTNINQHRIHSWKGCCSLLLSLSIQSSSRFQPSTE